MHAAGAGTRHSRLPFASRRSLLHYVKHRYMITIVMWQFRSSRYIKHMKVNPKNLILDLMLAVGDKPMTARAAVLAGALFKISENSLRVTLARLSAAGLIEVAGRAAYRLGPAATDLAGEVAGWRRAEARLRPWHGG